MAQTFKELVGNGPLLLAMAAAALAGLVSFLSPCILPLVPGYLSYVTGLAGADLDRALGSEPAGGVATLAPPRLRSRVECSEAESRSASQRRQGRVLAGTLLFVAGFAAVFTVTAVVAARVGKLLFRYAHEVEVGVGVLIVLFGLAFLGAVPGLQREWRISRLPAAGLAGAPVFGAVFALSWVPCVGPTLGAVLGLAAVGGQTGRAVVLALAYCFGLGLPFVAFGVGFRRLIGVVAVVRRNARWVTRIGGILLIVVGLALVTGGWTGFANWLRATVGIGEVPL